MHTSGAEQSKGAVHAQHSTSISTARAEGQVLEEEEEDDIEHYTEDELAEMQHNIQELLSRVTKLEEALSVTNARITQLEGGLETTKTRITQLEGGLATTNARIAELAVELAMTRWWPAMVPYIDELEAAAPAPTPIMPRSCAAEFRSSCRILL